MIFSRRDRSIIDFKCFLSKKYICGEIFRAWRGHNISDHLEMGDCCDNVNTVNDPLTTINNEKLFRQRFSRMLPCYQN